MPENTTYPLTNLLPLGTTIKVTHVSRYDNQDYIGQVGVIEDHDTYDNERPYYVRFDSGHVAWVNGRDVVEVPAIESAISSSDITELFTRHSVSATFAVELIALLSRNNITVNWN